MSTVDNETFQFKLSFEENTILVEEATGEVEINKITKAQLQEVLKPFNFDKFVWLKGPERGIQFKGPLSMKDSTIAKAFDYGGKLIEKYDGPWITKGLNALNYMRGC